MVTVLLRAHPFLDAGAFVTEFPKPLGESPAPEWLSSLLRLDAKDVPLRSDENVRTRVRDLLRHGGYKPTGRGKPASEYLLRAVGESALSAINLAVDTCNIASLHSGLPISVVDLAKAQAPFSIEIAAEGAQYVFNASGQSIDLAGLLCLCDAEGPSANAVKDAQRTKTNAETTRTLSIVWGTNALPEHTAKTVAWYRSLLERAGARTFDVELRRE